MKSLRIMWIASILWAVFWAYAGQRWFRDAWHEESTLFELGDKLERYLAAVGSMTVGLMPFSLTWLAHKFQKSRERGRLLKEKHRIELRLQKLDEDKDTPATDSPNS